MILSLTLGKYRSFTFIKITSDPEKKLLGAYSSDTIWYRESGSSSRKILGMSNVLKLVATFSPQQRLIIKSSE